MDFDTASRARVRRRMIRGEGEVAGRKDEGVDGVGWGAGEAVARGHELRWCRDRVRVAQGQGEGSAGTG